MWPTPSSRTGRSSARSTRPSSGDFGGFLAARDDEVAEALLAITDRRRDNSNRPTIVKAYNTIRGRASKQVKAALPALGLLIQKYA